MRVKRRQKHVILRGPRKVLKNVKKQRFWGYFRNWRPPGRQKSKSGFWPKIGPYGVDHNFWENRQNGHFSTFFGPPGRPQKGPQNWSL